MRDIVYLDIETIPKEMVSIHDPSFSYGTEHIEDPDAKYKACLNNWKKEVKKRSLSNIDCKMISLSYAINDEPVVNIFNENESQE